MDWLYVNMAGWMGSYLEPFLYALIFLATVLVIVGITYWLMSGISPVDRRLREIAEGRSAAARITHREGAFNVKWIAPVVRLVEPVDGWEKSTLRSRLVRAGYREKKAINVLVFSKIVMAFVFPLIVFIPFLLTPTAESSRVVMISLLVISALIGLYLPDFFLERKSRKRTLRFQEGFPDAMDMLVVCVEAGLGLDAAIQRVGKELHVSHPELSAEFNLVSLELRAGKGRSDALRSLADRTGLDEIRSLTSVLIQSEHFGTSIAEALRDQSTEMRTLRLQRAKERAAKLPVKLIFPIIFFIFPALFLVILGPALIRIYTGFIQGFH